MDRPRRQARPPWAADSGRSPHSEFRTAISSARRPGVVTPPSPQSPRPAAGPRGTPPLRVLAFEFLGAVPLRSLGFPRSRAVGGSPGGRAAGAGAERRVPRGPEGRELPEGAAPESAVSPGEGRVSVGGGPPGAPLCSYLRFGRDRAPPRLVQVPAGWAGCAFPLLGSPTPSVCPQGSLRPSGPAGPSAVPGPARRRGGSHDLPRPFGLEPRSRGPSPRLGAGREGRASKGRGPGVPERRALGGSDPVLAHVCFCAAVCKDPAPPCPSAPSATRRCTSSSVPQGASLCLCS
ncbi:collagen alpha-1(I) chain isoform X1 [Manis pentadactyla]|uniref:collagen alpha-1(I) chain isoform X1 n=1 Tax=Manis pentadactyla TaxID=143292 RepID=UPI0018769229|nr:collagen alpha-1(I) chain isoform X1 [Manis pentadactyla]